MIGIVKRYHNGKLIYKSVRRLFEDDDDLIVTSEEVLELYYISGDNTYSTIAKKLKLPKEAVLSIENIIADDLNNRYKKSDAYKHSK